MREADPALVEVDDPRLERGAKACLTIDSGRCFRDSDRGMCMCGRRRSGSHGFAKAARAVVRGRGHAGIRGRVMVARDRRRRRCAAGCERSRGRRTGCRRTRPARRREPVSAGPGPGVTARRGAARRRRVGRPRRSMTRSEGSARRSSSTSRLSSPERREKSNPTRSDRSRRPAKARPPAEAGSSHWTSSTATTTGRSSASARNAVKSARPIACGSGGGPSSSPRTSARESARLCAAGRAASASSSTVSRRSPMPENDSAVSLSAGRAARMRNPRSPASSRPACPEGGLSDAGVAFERERHGTLGDAGHETAKGRKLDVPSHDAGGHDPTIVSRCLRRGSGPLP